MVTNSQKRHQGGAGRPVKRGTCKVRTRSLKTCHVTLTIHQRGMMATTDGAKAPTPRPRAAAHGSRVYTVNAVHTYTTLSTPTPHRPHLHHADSDDMTPVPMPMSNCVGWMMGALVTTRPLSDRAPANTALPTPTPEWGKTRRQASTSASAANDAATAPGPAGPNVNQHPPPLLRATAHRVDTGCRYNWGTEEWGRGTVPPPRRKVIVTGEGNEAEGAREEGWRRWRTHPLVG
jgi:hypothetical protein